MHVDFKERNVASKKVRPWVAAHVVTLVVRQRRRITGVERRVRRPDKAESATHSAVQI